MGTEPRNGHAARIDRLEEDGRENRRRRDELIRDNEEAHRRLWQEITKLALQVIEIETRAEERHQQILRAIKNCDDNVAELVEKHDDQQKEARQGSTALKVAAITAAAIVLAALITFLQQVMAGA